MNEPAVLEDQVPMDTPDAPLTNELWTDPVVDTVCERFAPFWPLESMVATNPYLGFVERQFDAAAEYNRRIVGRPMTMNRDWFLEQVASGRITDADLEEALGRSNSPMDLAGLKLAMDAPAPLAIPQLLYSNMRDGRYRPSHSGYVVQQISQLRRLL